MITASESLAEAIGFSYKSLKNGVDAGRFSPRMALALESHLGLEKGTLKRTSDVGARRMAREHREVFRSLINIYVWRDGIEKTSRLMEAHYEVSRQIVSGVVLPTILNIRALIRNTGDDRFMMFDDPSYVYVDQENQNILGRRIRDRRVELGITQKQVGLSLGCSNHDICRYEKGRRDIPEEKILLLAEVLKDPELPRIAHECQDRKVADDSRKEVRANAA